MKDRAYLDSMSEEELLARTLKGEAGNESDEGILAAASVIRNRAKEKGMSLRDVIMQRGQFSLYNDITGHAGGEGANKAWKGEVPQNIRYIANGVVNGNAPDPTNGATHYYNPKTSNPSWGRGKQYKDIGNHRFMRADDDIYSPSGNTNLDPFFSGDGRATYDMFSGGAGRGPRGTGAGGSYRFADDRLHSADGYAEGMRDLFAEDEKTQAALFSQLMPNETANLQKQAMQEAQEKKQAEVKAEMAELEATTTKLAQAGIPQEHLINARNQVYGGGGQLSGGVPPSIGGNGGMQLPFIPTGAQISGGNMAAPFVPNAAQMGTEVPQQTKQGGAGQAAVVGGPAQDSLAQGGQPQPTSEGNNWWGRNRANIFSMGQMLGGIGQAGTFDPAKAYESFYAMEQQRKDAASGIPSGIDGTEVGRTARNFMQQGDDYETAMSKAVELHNPSKVAAPAKPSAFREKYNIYKQANPEMSDAEVLDLIDGEDRANNPTTASMLSDRAAHSLFQDGVVNPSAGEIAERAAQLSVADEAANGGGGNLTELQSLAADLRAADPELYKGAEGRVQSTLDAYAHLNVGKSKPEWTKRQIDSLADAVEASGVVGAELLASDIRAGGVRPENMEKISNDLNSGAINTNTDLVAAERQNRQEGVLAAAGMDDDLERQKVYATEGNAAGLAYDEAVKQISDETRQVADVAANQAMIHYYMGDDGFEIPEGASPEVIKTLTDAAEKHATKNAVAIEEERKRVDLEDLRASMAASGDPVLQELAMYPVTDADMLSKQITQHMLDENSSPSDVLSAKWLALPSTTREQRSAYYKAKRSGAGEQLNPVQLRVISDFSDFVGTKTEQAANARLIMPRLITLGNLMGPNGDGVDSGAFQAAFEPFKRFIESGTGINLGTAKSQTFESIANSLFSYMKNNGIGALSNIDVERIMKGIPGLDKSPLGNMVLLQMYKNMNRYDELQGDFMSNYMAQNAETGDLTKLTRGAATAAWDVYREEQGIPLADEFIPMAKVGESPENFNARMQSLADAGFMEQGNGVYVSGDDIVQWSGS